MSDQLKKQIRRLGNKIETLERRNQSLRAEVERMTHGEQPAWTEFEEANAAVFGDGTHIDKPKYRLFINSRYQVTVFPSEPVDYNFAPGAMLTWLSIKRQDGAAIMDWRELQRIKNEILGDEAEGVMLYPAESRCVDGANQYHLHCLCGGQWPFGFKTRLVAEDNNDGVQQRPFEPDQRPKDLVSVSMEQMRAVYEAGG
jgi:hypothetical protein